MSCDLLENAKQGYMMSNGTTLETNSTNEVITLPKPVENNSLDQVFLAYTPVSCNLFFFLLFHIWLSGTCNSIIWNIFRRQSNVKIPQ